MPDKHPDLRWQWHAHSFAGLGGVRTALPTNKMAIISDFAAMADDFTFTVSFNNFTAMTTEEV